MRTPLHCSGEGKGRASTRCMIPMRVLVGSVLRVCWGWSADRTVAANSTVPDGAGRTASTMAAREAARLLARLRAPAGGSEPFTGRRSDPGVWQARVCQPRQNLPPLPPAPGFHTAARAVPACRLRPSPHCRRPANQPAAGGRKPAGCQQQRCCSGSGRPGDCGSRCCAAVAGACALRGTTCSRQRFPPTRRGRGAAGRMAGLVGQLFAVGRPPGSRARLAAGGQGRPTSGGGLCLCAPLPVALLWLRAIPGRHGERCGVVPRDRSPELLLQHPHSAHRACCLPACTPAKPAASSWLLPASRP